MSFNCMLFVEIMSKRKIYLYSVLICLVFFIWIFSDSNEKNEDLSERVKIALREVGNQLLLSDNDSISLVLPIIELEKFKYKLSFQNQLSFEPTNLTSIIKSSFQKAELPNYYRVEVIQCSDNEVAYSYQMSAEKEDTIIPCAGRLLPNGCYSIEVRFTNKISVFFTKQLALTILIILVFIFMLDYFYSKRKQSEELDETAENHTKLGSFQFYPEQNKLVKQATEISLSKKECELLAIFVANPNQIIKRDELTKRVWEDHGVFVGRSLDTYISKLRKKLKEDASIKLINIHGVGYKLEIINQ